MVVLVLEEGENRLADITNSKTSPTFENNFLKWKFKKRGLGLLNAVGR